MFLILVTLRPGQRGVLPGWRMGVVGPSGVSTRATVRGRLPRSEGGEGGRNATAGQYTGLTAPLHFCTKACSIASLIHSF